MADHALATITYGDGLHAYFYDDKGVRVNKEGIRVIPMLIAPSIQIIRKYGLTEEDLVEELPDGYPGIWMDYPVNQIDWLNRSPLSAEILIWCGFDGREMPIMRKMEGLFEWDLYRDKTENALKAGLATAAHMIQDAFDNPIEIMRKLKEMEEIIGERGQSPEEEYSNQ